MNNLQLTHIPVAKAEMLIRKPVAEVFEAFINPEITTRFWFTKSSGRLDAGKQVTWTWEMYNASSQVTVREVEQNKRILIEWSGYGSPMSIARQNILRVLRESDTSLGPLKIADGTGLDYAKVRKLLSSMSSERKITSVSRGLYTTPQHPCLTTNSEVHSHVTTEQVEHSEQTSQTKRSEQVSQT